MMDAKNIRALVNLTGGYESGLVETVNRFDKAYPGRFFTCCEPSYSRLLEPGYPKLQAQAIADAHAAGARGLKILKTLGLFLRENITTGRLVRVDGGWVVDAGGLLAGVADVDKATRQLNGLAGVVRTYRRAIGRPGVRADDIDVELGRAILKELSGVETDRPHRFDVRAFEK